MAGGGERLTVAESAADVGLGFGGGEDFFLVGLFAAALLPLELDPLELELESLEELLLELELSELELRALAGAITTTKGKDSVNVTRQ